MKKLLTLAALGLSLNLTSYSFAQGVVNVFGVRRAYNAFDVLLPLVKSNTADTKSLHRAYKESDDAKDYIVVFGVNVPVGPRT